jgi:hypothetical protein
MPRADHSLESSALDDVKTTLAEENLGIRSVVFHRFVGIHTTEVLFSRMCCYFCRRILRTLRTVDVAHTLSHMRTAHVFQHSR